MAAIETIDKKTNAALVPAASSESRGKTFVSDEVITTIARLTAESVEGVHKIGVSGLRGMLGKLGKGGVSSEVGMRQAAVSLDVIVDYGYPITVVADALRESIIDAIEHMASREVVAVDINVVDIHIEKSKPETSRLALD